MSNHFDYRVVKLNNKGPGTIEALLNQAARQGFRLFSVTGGRQSYAILERVTDERVAIASDPDEHARYFAEKAGWMKDDSGAHWQS